MSVTLTAICQFLNRNCRETQTHTQPFYGSVDFVWDNPGEPVPEEAFTHSHSSWSSIIPICFLQRNLKQNAKPKQLLTFFIKNVGYGKSVKTSLQMPEIT